MDVRDARGEYRIEPTPAATADEVPQGYKRTEVGVIPESWNCVQAKEIGSFRGGNGFPLVWQGRSSGDYPFFKVSDMNNEGNDTFMRASNNRISEHVRKQLGATVFPTGSIVFAKIGAAVFLERKKILAEPSCIDNNMAACVVDESRADIRFVHTHFLNKKFGSLVETTALPALSGSQFGAMPLALPPLPEQRAIAEALSDADALLGALDRLIAKKRDLKQAAMQQLLTGHTRLPGFTKEWEMKRLGDYAAFLKHGVNSRAELVADGEVKYLHYGDIHGADGLLLDPNMTQMPCLSKPKASGLDRLSDGDLVFADASEDVDGVGKSVELCGVGQTEVVSGMHTVAVRFDKEVLADGFKAYLQFIPAFRQHLRRLAAGTKVYATNKAHIASAEVLLPEAEEQIAVAAVLADMDAEIEALEARRAKTRDLKQAMMQELLTGRTRLI